MFSPSLTRLTLLESSWMSPELSNGYADGARSLLKTRSSCCPTPRLVIPRVTIDPLIELGAVTFHSLSTTAGAAAGADDAATADAAADAGGDAGRAADSDLAGCSADGDCNAVPLHPERTTATKTGSAASRVRSMVFTRQLPGRVSRSDQIRSFPKSRTPRDLRVTLAAARSHDGCRRSRSIGPDGPKMHAERLCTTSHGSDEETRR